VINLNKLILILVALVMMASGVAAVSAYEAHTINVTAHVENAMSVNKDHLEFGTVFPEDWMLDNFSVGTSGSFCAPDQWRVTLIDYSIWVEWKPIPEDANPYPDSVVVGTDGNDYYPWLGDALYLGIDAVDLRPIAAGGDLTPVGPVLPPGPQGAIKVMDSSTPLNKNPGPVLNLNDTITVGLDVPVFEGYYNMYTDVPVKQSGLSAPTVVILESDTARYFPDGVDLGVDIKIQVENIYNPVP
jgi:hypothetical protein